MLSSRFRALYRNLGLTRPMAAKLLHVSERTLHNWESGHHEIPYAAYKLLRILSRHELPGKAWAGWVFHSSRLWSPEGHSFTPQDSSWWSLLIRKSKTWHALYCENVQLRKDLAAARAPATTGGDGKRSAVATGGAGGEGEVPVTLHQSLNFETFCPARVRYNLSKTLFTKTVEGVRHV